MKTTKKQLMNVAFVILYLSSNVVDAQSINGVTNETVGSMNSFEVGTFMGEKLTLNLMLAVHKAEGVTIRIKDKDSTILHEQRLKKSPIVYHQKLSFSDAKPGTYQVEISDGHKTVVRQVEVVDIPAIESQRYITYRSHTY